MSIFENTKVASGEGIGGGGAPTITWFSPSGGGVSPSEENGDLVYLFFAGSENVLNGFLTAPETRSISKQIKLKIDTYSSSITNQYELQVIAYLIRNGIDDLNSVSNLFSSTAININSAPSNKKNRLEFDLSDVNGLINGLPVNAGDSIKIELKRIGDTDTETVKLLASTSEVTI